MHQMFVECPSLSWSECININKVMPEVNTENSDHTVCQQQNQYQLTVTRVQCMCVCFNHMQGDYLLGYMIILLVKQYLLLNKEEYMRRCAVIEK